MKVELVCRGRLPLDPDTKTVPQGDQKSILAVSARSVALLDKDQHVVRLTRKMGFLTRARLLKASQTGCPAGPTAPSDTESAQRPSSQQK
ncbi:hypothetical protein BIW11_13381 [Tropilaelaps mercedesae]|uniref:Uncharacterized protein n=1 Tax=Tropilaelaps mercedesae TaxID=418985 RepID=A0A1V9X2P4_9ACAR|nr:hypothetical protein BIW11_13381 [Tropilaelaps mercedesae]